MKLRALVPILSLTLLACHLEFSLSDVSVVTADAGVLADVAPITAETAEPYHPKLMPRRVLIVGDSEAGRVSWVIKDVKDSDDVVDVVYKGGTPIAYWASNGAHQLNQAFNDHPGTDTVVIFLGTNDWYRKTLPDVDPILKAVTDRGISCVWVGPTSVHGKKWPINDMLENKVSSVCSYFNTEVAEISLEDGVHPNQQEARKWLGMVWLMVPPKFAEITQ